MRNSLSNDAKYLYDMCRAVINGELNSYLKYVYTTLKGAGGGLPWGQIMENEFEYLVDRGGHGGYLAEKVLKKYCS